VKKNERLYGTFSKASGNPHFEREMLMSTWSV